MQKRIRSSHEGTKAYRVQQDNKMVVKDVINQSHTVSYKSKLNDKTVVMREKESVLHKSTISQEEKRAAKRVKGVPAKKEETVTQNAGTARSGSVNSEIEAIAQGKNDPSRVSQEYVRTNGKYRIKNYGNVVKGAENFPTTSAVLSRENQRGTQQVLTANGGRNRNANAETKTNSYTAWDWRKSNGEGRISGQNTISAFGLASTALKIARIPGQFLKSVESTDEDIGTQVYRKGKRELSKGAGDIVWKARTRAVKSAQAAQGKGRLKTGTRKPPSRRQRIKSKAKKAGATAKNMVVKAQKSLKKVAFIAKNPVVLQALAIIIAVILLIAIVAVVGGAVVSSTQSAKTLIDPVLFEEIKKYSREKDKALQKKFQEYEKQPQYADIAEEDVKKVMEGSCSTNITVLTSYLLAKYDNSLSLAVAKGEIDRLHKILYSISASEGSSSEEREVPILDKNGKPKKDKNGKEMTEKVADSRKTLTVTLKCTALKKYLEENPSLFPDEKTKEFYEHLLFTATLWNGNGTGWGLPFEDDVYNNNITCHFGGPDAAGKPHRGTDFAAPQGVEILAVLDGTVIEAGFHSSWGNTVLTETEDGEYRVRYAHMVAFEVGVGDTVGTGDIIGFVGTTGFSTGPHLHLEVQENGMLVNSLDYIGEASED